MSNALPLNIAEYSAAHRNRERNENGWVKLVGKREKKWKGFFHLYEPQPNGTSKRVRRTIVLGSKAEIPTKGKAEDALRVIVRQQLALPMANTARATVADLCDDYLALRSSDWEESTRKTNTSIITRVIRDTLGHLPIERVTPEDLKRMISDLPNRTWSAGGRIERGVDGKTHRVAGTGKTRKGVSASYVKKIIAHVRSMFDLASERDLIVKNPARSINIRLRIPKHVAKVDKSVFPPQYLPALLAELDTRDRLVVWLSILGATRPNELFAVRGGDVGPSGAWIHIERALDRNKQVKSTKSDKARFIHLPADLAADLQGWVASQGIGAGDWLFQDRHGKPVFRDSFLKCRLRPAAKRAMIPVLDVDFQMLRRSFATLAQFAGLDIKAIQSQLGHAKPDMTATVYMQPVDALTIQQLGRLEDMLRGRVPMTPDSTARLVTVQ